MGRVLFIGKPLKASKNSLGLKTELHFSQNFHIEGIPLLVSAQILRVRTLGQIDLARLKKDSTGWIIEIGEVKSSKTGAQTILRSQRQRLLNAQRFLSGLFGHRSKLIILTKDGPADGAD